MGTCTTRTFAPDLETVAGSDLDAVSDLLADKSLTVWIDLERPDAGELDRLAEELGLHHLAIEDALDDHQRDKLVHYEEHVFLVAHHVVLDADEAELVTTEIDAFVGERWMVTVHDGAHDLIEQVVHRRGRTRELDGGGVGTLLYVLLDVIVDGYFTALDQFEAYYDEAADRIFADEPIEPGQQRQWFEMRRALNRFDRIVTPLSDGVGSLIERDLARFEESSWPYLKDVAVETHRATTEVDSLRDLVHQIAEVNITLRDYRQNVVMKKVTSWAAVIAVPTLITGYYGMNVPYPGSEQTWGVIVASALSLGASGSLYLLFKRKGWI